MDFSKSSKTISILGCGWLGKALQHHLVAQGHRVQCLSRELDANQEQGWYDCDVLVIAIPPKGEYLSVLKETLDLLEVGAQVIFLNSISCYDGKALVVEGEALLHRLWPDAVALRLGGLMGIDRIAGKYTAGKRLPYDSMSNYVHREDVVGVITAVITQEVRAEVLDVVAPVQHLKSEIFRANAEKFGFERTQFDSLECRGKVISSKRLEERLKYRFFYPDVNGFWE